jgi:hypothetical protein
MTKQERRLWIQRRVESDDDIVGELPISNREIQEEVEELDSFREYLRDVKTSQTALTSDAL